MSHPKYVYRPLKRTKSQTVLTFFPGFIASGPDPYGQFITHLVRSGAEPEDAIDRAHELYLERTYGIRRAT